MFLGRAKSPFKEATTIMYLPAHFTETDAQSITGLIAEFPLATLVAGIGDGVAAHHLPLLLLGEDRLVGHVALANDLHRQLEDGAPVMAIFRGESSYVSPNWYPTKQMHHRHVPTWNYEIVHVHGRISFQHDSRTKRAVVGRLTKSMETRINGSEGWRMADAPAEFIEANLANIVAFSIEIERIVGKSKLSQNREPVDHEAVRQVMDETGHKRLASRMKMHTVHAVPEPPAPDGANMSDISDGANPADMSEPPDQDKK
jgi:transcriptional regulator